MPKRPYLDRSDNGLAKQMITFKTNIGSYASTLGLDVDQITAQADDADYYDYLCRCQQLAHNADTRIMPHGLRFLRESRAIWGERAA